MADDALSKYLRGETGNALTTPQSPAMAPPGVGGAPGSTSLDEYLRGGSVSQNVNPLTRGVVDANQPPIARYLDALPSTHRFNLDPRFQEMTGIMDTRRDFRQRSVLAPAIDTVNPSRYINMHRYNSLKRELAADYFIDTDVIDAAVDYTLQRAGRWDPARDFTWTQQAGTFTLRKAGQFLKPFAYLQDLAFAANDDIYDLIFENERSFSDSLNVLRNTGGYFNILDEGVPERPIEFGDLMRNTVNATGLLIGKASGREAAWTDEDLPRSFYQATGILGDLIVDPLMMGAAVRGLGKAVKVASAAGDASRTADRIIDVGNAIETILSPAGVFQGGQWTLRRTLPEAVYERLDDGMATAFNTILNAPMTLPGWGVLGRQAGRPTTLGEFVGVRRNPLRPDQDILSGGAGTPEAFLEAARTGRMNEEQMLTMLKDSFEQIEGALGRPVARGWVQDLFMTARKKEQIAQRAGAMPGPLQEQILALAWDVGDNMGPLARLDLVERVAGGLTRSEDATVLAGTIADELRRMDLDLRAVAPTLSESERPILRDVYGPNRPRPNPERTVFATPESRSRRQPVTQPWAPLPSELFPTMPGENQLRSLQGADLTIAYRDVKHEWDAYTMDTNRPKPDLNDLWVAARGAPTREESLEMAKIGQREARWENDPFMEEAFGNLQKETLQHATRVVEPMVAPGSRTVVIEEAARRALPKTRVVNEQGFPVRVYHGTRSVFDKPDPAFEAGGNLYGPGTYFTEGLPSSTGEEVITSGYSVSGGVLGWTSTGGADVFDPSNLALWPKRSFDPATEGIDQVRAFIQDTPGGYLAGNTFNQRLPGNPSAPGGKRLLSVAATPVTDILDVRPTATPEVLEFDLRGPHGVVTVQDDLASLTGFKMPRPNIHRAYLDIRNPLDLELPFAGPMHEALPQAFGANLIDTLKATGVSDTIAERAIEKIGEDLATIIKLNGNNLKLTDWYDNTATSLMDVMQEFYQSSNLTTQATMPQRSIHYARGLINDTLKRMGYDGLSHIGGGNTGHAPHKVWVAFHRDQIMNDLDVLGRAGEDLTMQHVDFPTGTPYLMGNASLVELDAVARVRSLASEYKVDPNDAERAFQDVLEASVAADTVMGYHQSLYGPIKQAFYKNAMQHGMDSENIGALWRDMIAHAGADESVNVLDLTEVDGVPLASLFDEESGITRVRDLMDGTELAASLDLSTYLRALTQGHLRRVFGVFQDERGLRSFAESLRRQDFQNPSVLSGRIMDLNGEDSAVLKLAARGFDDEAVMVQQYIEHVAPYAPGERGVVIRQESLARYLLDQGVDPKRVEDTLGTLIAEMRPDLEAQYGRLMDYADKRRNLRQMTESNVLAPKNTVAERADLDVETLEALGQLPDARVALTEQAATAAKRVNKQTALAEIWRSVTETPAYQEFIRPGTMTPRPNERRYWTLVEDNATNQAVYGPFAGKYVQSTLLRQIHGLLATPSQTTTALGQVRSLITGGYLANPATTFANVGGGFYTAFLKGENPFRLLQNMVGVARDWAIQGKDLPELREVGGVLMTGMHSNELAKIANVAKLEDVGITAATFPDRVRKLQEAYRGMLEYPLGQTGGQSRVGGAWNAISGAMGLRGFEFSEDLFKLGMYRMARAEGDSVDQALRRAREVVFDFSDTPGYVDLLRDTGVALFPGYAHFIIGRTLDAIVNRPGTVAMSERLPEAVWNAQFPGDDEEQMDLKYLVWRSMPEHMRSNKFVPLRKRTSPGGQTTYDMFPLGDFTPGLGAFLNNPLVGQIGQTGIWTAALDLALAGRKQGELTWAARYGRQRAFETPEETDSGSPLETAAQIGKYLYSAYAPAWPRKLWTPEDPGEDDPSGLIPAVRDHVLPTPTSMPGAFDAYTAKDLATRKADRDLTAEVLRLFTRSTQTTSLDPLFSAPLRQYRAEKREATDKAGTLKDKANRLMVEANNPNLSDSERRRLQRQAEQFYLRAINLTVKVDTEWSGLLQSYADYLRSQGRQP